MAAGIYQIRNKLNGKIYIGSTLNFDKRKIDHLKKKRVVNKRLKSSILHYGIENFIFEILDIIDLTGFSKELSKNMLIAWEQYYVDIYDPEYNIMKEDVTRPIGISNLGINGHKVSVFNLQDEFIETLDSIQITSRKYGISCSIIERTCKCKRRVPPENYIFKYKIKD